MGYGDIGCMGIQQLILLTLIGCLWKDKMDTVLFAASVCTPSRAALLTELQ